MYATVEQYLERFSLSETLTLSNVDDPTTNAVDDARITTALEDASLLINSILSPRWIVPIDPPPPELISPCCEIARAAMDTTRGGDRQSVDQRRQAAIKAVSLLLEDGAVLPGATRAGQPSIQYTAPPLVFDNWTGFF